MTTRALRAIAVAVALGGVATAWAGTVVDGSGSFVLGTWAILWGGVAALIGFGLGAGGRGLMIRSLVTGRGDRD